MLKKENVNGDIIKFLENLSQKYSFAARLFDKMDGFYFYIKSSQSHKFEEETRSWNK